MTPRSHGADTLSPRVAALVERVMERIRTAPTPGQVQALAGEALAVAPADALTAAEITELTELALSQALLVESEAARLAELIAGGAR